MRPVGGEGVAVDRKRVLDALVLRAARGVGDRGFRRLVDTFGSPGAVLDTDPGALKERREASEKLSPDSITASSWIEGRLAEVRPPQ